MTESDEKEMRDREAVSNNEVSKDNGSALKGDGDVDSDKENTDAPMDLTNIPAKSGSEEEIAALSDEEIELQSDRKLKEKYRLIKMLQEELRNEEAKLVLLKKIRQSQVMQQVQENTPNTQAKGPLHNRPSHGVPPPLVRGGQQQPHKMQPQPPQLSRGQPPLMNRPQSSQGPPPLVMAPNRSSHGSQVSGRGNTSIGSSQSVVPGYRGSQSSQSQQQQQPEQTPAQRQAAAKLALRKQLEKTLLQIPPPKPPPPEMNFIPSLLGNEFIMLVGLEEVVKKITETDARLKGEKTAEVKYVFNPFVCVQCGTDFTPVWKRDKPGSKNVICEQCVTTNQKKALKQEHTNRLKSAFVKALQQEQEIEQRMQQQQQQQQQREREREREREQRESQQRERHRESDHQRMREESHQSQQAASSAAAAMAQATTLAHQAALAQIPGMLTSPINLSTIKPSKEQIAQHRNLLQAHQAQLRALGPLGLQMFNPRMAFPFTPQQADLQRQYLLDMIPSRNLQGGNLGWKN